MLRQLDYQMQFDTLVSADAQLGQDITTRRLLVTVSAVLLWMSIADPVFLIWGIGYLLGDLVYVRVLRTKATRVSALTFWLGCTISLVLGGWIGAMAVYLAWIDLYFLAACIVVGQALHCMSSHTEIGAGLLIDLMVVSATTVGVTLGTAMFVSPDYMAPAVMISGTAVLIYFVHSVRKVVLERAALRRRIAAEVQDQKMRALGQFTSGVAHDFNNILTVIAGNIELAQLDELPDPANDLLDEARAASLNAAALVKQLLAYSRKSTMNVRRIDVNEAIERLEKVACRVLPATITFEADLATQARYVHADAPLLETALLNLVINARDALQDRPGTITIRAEDHADPQHIAIAVEDNGPGMSIEVLSNATDPFFTTKGIGQGSGLGLSMVKGFAEQSGGSITLENRAVGGLKAVLAMPISEWNKDLTTGIGPLG